MPVITCIEDLRQMSKRRIAKAVFDYVDRGSYGEYTLRANRDDLESLLLRQRVGIDVEHRTTRSTMLGQDVSVPLALAPVGLTGLNWANGEMLAARAAERFGVPYTLSAVPLLERELERIQRQGWATDNEEAEIGVRCVAAGIRDDGGALVAALSLSTPADRMKVQWGPLVKETADRISRSIGHRPMARIGAV